MWIITASPLHIKLRVYQATKTLTTLQITTISTLLRLGTQILRRTSQLSINTQAVETTTVVVAEILLKSWYQATFLTGDTASSQLVETREVIKIPWASPDWY
jgi:hypothetical protein